MGNVEIYDILTTFLGQPKQVGYQRDSYSFNCPHCASENNDIPDNKYNLEINLNKQVFHCWKCEEYSGMKGTLLKLINKYGKRGDKKRYIDLTKHNLKLGDLIKNDINIFPPYNAISFKELDRVITDEAKPYFDYLTKERGLTWVQLEYYEFGYVPYGKMGGSVFTVSRDENGFIEATIYRKVIETQYNKKYANYKIACPNKNKITFWGTKLNFNSTLYLGEGHFDAICLPNGLPLLGKTLSEHNLMKMKKNNVKRVVVCLDKDVELNKIMKMCKDIRETIGCEVYYFDYTNIPYGDINEIVTKKSYEYLGQCLKTNIKKYE